MGPGKGIIKLSHSDLLKLSLAILTFSLSAQQLW